MPRTISTGRKASFCDFLRLLVVLTQCLFCHVIVNILVGVQASDVLGMMSGAKEIDEKLSLGDARGCTLRGFSRSSIGDFEIFQSPAPVNPPNVARLVLLQVGVQLLKVERLVDFGMVQTEMRGEVLNVSQSATKGSTQMFAVAVGSYGNGSKINGFNEVAQ